MTVFSCRLYRNFTKQQLKWICLDPRASRRSSSNNSIRMGLKLKFQQFVWDVASHKKCQLNFKFDTVCLFVMKSRSFSWILRWRETLGLLTSHSIAWFQIFLVCFMVHINFLNFFQFRIREIGLHESASREILCISAEIVGLRSLSDFR